MSDETLLIVSLALCFGDGGAGGPCGLLSSLWLHFIIMGSILAETVESEHIDKACRAAREILFAAIFGVSVGITVGHRTRLWSTSGRLLAIVVAILLGQTIFGAAGVLLSGQPFRKSPCSVDSV